MNTTDPLELDTETMRRMGYQVVDSLVERISTLRVQPAWRGIKRAELEPLLREQPPEQPVPFEQLLERLTSDVLAYGAHVDHPRFFAFVPGCPTWPGILGDMIAAGHQSFAGTWLGGAGPAMLELVVLDWFREWLGLPTGSSGLLLSGGSVANLTAIAAARITRLGENFDDATIYFSSEAHSSVERACRVLGFKRDRLRIVPAETDGRLAPDRLRAAIADDVADGLRPFCLIANAGTTSTGSIDPLHDLATIAHDHRMWYHVDAAYGGFAVLTARGKQWLAGIERADSVTLDPHKWLYQPFEVGCLMVRDENVLAEAFHIMPNYLQDTVVKGGELNFGERGIQLTRAARAIKVWLSLQYFGVDAFRSAIDSSLDLTIEAQQYIEASPDLELLTPARLGIVCFRRLNPQLAPAELDAFNEQLQTKLLASGLAMVSSTRVDGMFALRLCVLNHRTSREDVRTVLDWIAAARI